MRSLAAQARDVRDGHTGLDEIIRIVNVTRVWERWRKPVLVVVSSDLPQHYAYLRDAFSDVPWAHVVVDRRQLSRGEGSRPWTIVHADRIETEANPSVSQWSEMFGPVRLLRWVWTTGVRIGGYAAYRTLTLGRG